MERKLAVILVADIVGYSAQMERDEAGTYARVTARRREVFEPEIARHNGRVFKLTGDGLLAEFSSAVQAVECAVALQEALAARNAGVPPAEAILARIGINLGEVIVDGDDRYGEGVNIAARLEQLADPGGICVSDKVAREVEKKLAFGFESMGAQKVKNIAEPVVAYRVSRAAGPRARAPGRPSKRWMAWTAALMGVALTFAAVAFLWWPKPQGAALQGPVSLAVLPFETGSAGPDQDYLTKGVAEMIAVTLGSSPDLGFVIAPVDKDVDATTDMKALAGELGVDLLLAGNIKTDAGEIAFEGRLLNGKTGGVLSEISQDVAGGDLVGLQYRVASDVLAGVAAASGSAQASGLDPGWSRISDSPEAYALSLRANEVFNGPTFNAAVDAIELLDTGLQRYPQSVWLRVRKADLLSIRLLDLPQERRWSEAETAWALLSGVPNPSELSLIEQWYVHMMRALAGPNATGDFSTALRDAEAAHRLSPGLPNAHLRMSDIAASAGRGDLAIAWAQVGVTPDRPPSDAQRNAIATALLVAGRPEEALAEYEQVNDWCLSCKVVALVRTGRLDEARELVADIQRDRRFISIEWVRTLPTGRQPAMAEPYLTAWLDDLRKAGLPETGPPE